MFDDPLGNTQYYYFYVVGVVFFFCLLLLLIKLFRSKSSASEQHNLMMFTDIEKMKNAGLIDEEEYRKIRSRAAHQELERSKEKERIERDLILVDQAKVNPDLAREMLTEEEIQSAAVHKKELEALRHHTAESPAGPQAQAQRPSPPPAPKETPPATTPEAPSRESELDTLLQKGAIGKEEYERLKKFFTK